MSVDLRSVRYVRSESDGNRQNWVECDICLHFVEYNIVVYTMSKRAYVSIRFFETPLYLI